MRKYKYALEKDKEHVLVIKFRGSESNIVFAHVNICVSFILLCSSKPCQRHFKVKVICLLSNTRRGTYSALYTFEFYKGSNATVATKNICDVYPSALDVPKCRKSDYFDLSDSYRLRGSTILNNDVLRAEMKANPCQTIEELSNSLNQP
ncbi:histone-lysine N-methyltransferase SETMAR-like, partial [Vespula squamosa]